MPRSLAAILVAIVLLAGLAPGGTAGAAPPAGFVEEVVPGLDNLGGPTAFAFLPDGAMLIALREGRLLLYQGGTLRPAPVFDRTAATCSNGERGLLGVAVDPQFAANRFVYVYYTFNRANDPSCPTNSANQPVNRLSRLTLSPGFTTAQETVLLDNIGSPNGNHNAGDVQFGKDGFLYVSIGDGGANAETARQLFNLNGTIVRITRDGGVPADNPFQGADTARCNNGPTAPANRCQEIFAYGFRNPFRLAFDPNAAGTRLFVNDVGAGAVEEISEARGGGDFGWPCFEGTRPNQSGGLCGGVTLDNTVRPSFEYRREGTFAGCASITGGAFVPAGAWPDRYDGAYLFADFICGRLFALVQGAPTAEVFDADVGAATHMAFGPDGALYYAQFRAGAIYRVRFAAPRDERVFLPMVRR
jgi:glucose/arabinose dehydrogenase